MFFTKWTAALLWSLIYKPTSNIHDHTAPICNNCLRVEAEAELTTSMSLFKASQADTIASAVELVLLASFFGMKSFADALNSWSFLVLTLLGPACRRMQQRQCSPTSNDILHTGRKHASATQQWGVCVHTCLHSCIVLMTAWLCCSDTSQAIECRALALQYIISCTCMAPHTVSMINWWAYLLEPPVFLVCVQQAACLAHQLPACNCLLAACVRW